MSEQLLKHANVKERLKRLRKISGKLEQLRRFHSDFENQEFLNWTKIQHENINYDKIMIQGAGYVTHLVDWCNNNCTDNYVAYKGHLYFKSEIDASYFTMVWK